MEDELIKNHVQTIVEVRARASVHTLWIGMYMNVLILKIRKYEALYQSVLCTAFSING